MLHSQMHCPMHGGIVVVVVVVGTHGVWAESHGPGAVAGWLHGPQDASWSHPSVVLSHWNAPVTCVQSEYHVPDETQSHPVHPGAAVVVVVVVVLQSHVVVVVVVPVSFVGQSAGG